MQVWIDAHDGLHFRVNCTEVVHKGLKEGQEFVVLSTIEFPTRNTSYTEEFTLLFWKELNQIKEHAYSVGSPWGGVLFILFSTE